jgi:hypothetical protein
VFVRENFKFVKHFHREHICSAGPYSGCVDPDKVGSIGGGDGGRPQSNYYAGDPNHISCGDTASAPAFFRRRSIGEFPAVRRSIDLVCFGASRRTPPLDIFGGRACCHRRFRFPTHRRTYAVDGTRRPPLLTHIPASAKGVCAAAATMTTTTPATHAKNR